MERAARLPRHSFADPVWGVRGAFRPRLVGFKQLVDLAARCGGHADIERASSRVRASRGLGEATDLTVAQAVVDEREHFASDSDGGFVFPAPLGDLVPIGSQFSAAVIANRCLRSPPSAPTATLAW